MATYLEKQAVSPADQMVFCPLMYRYVTLDRCRDCSRLVRVDDGSPERYVVCDARLADRRSHRRPGADASDEGPGRPR